jgi:hypothetical protein
MRNILLVGAVAAALAVACGDAQTSNLTGGNGTPGDPSTSGGPGEDGGTATDSGSSGGTSSGSSGTSSGSSGTASSGSSGADGGKPPPPPPGAGLPCNVQALLASKCDGCHSNPPVNGSLSPLVTAADMTATSKENASLNEAQLSVQKMQAGSMPPASVNNAATAAEIAVVQAWIAANYQGSCNDGGAPPPPSDVFMGAPAFSCTASGNSHNAGRNCLGCHTGGRAPKFTFAGTLRNAAGAIVPGAEVRMVDGAGKALSICTDGSGNFHTAQTWTAAAHVGVRDATKKALMVSTITDGGCNGCHTAGGAANSPVTL